jgi:hypothetical protein
MVESEANSVRESHPAGVDCFREIKGFANPRPVGKATVVAFPTIVINSTSAALTGVDHVTS